MADSPFNPKKNEMSMEMRLLLALLLTVPVIFLTQYLYPTQPPPAAKKNAVTQPSPAAATSANPDATKSPGPTTAEAAPIPGSTPQAVLPNVRIDNGYYQISISNQGATIRSWMMPAFKGNDGKALQLLNTASEAPPVLSLYFPGLNQADRDAMQKTVNWSYYQPKVDEDGLGVTYEFSNGHVAVKKSFRFEKNSYLSHIATEVTMDGKPVRHMIEWRGGFGDLTLPAPSITEKTAYFDVPDNKLIEKTAKDASGGPQTATGTFSFAGLTDTYFAAVFLPKNENGVETATFSDTVPTALEPKPSAFTGVAVQDGDTNDFRFFVGPKDVDTMKRIDPKLEQLVDFGWMSILAKPLFYAVNYVNDAFVHNFGWAIVVVTIVLNMVLLPLKFSSMKSMRKMQALKPQIDAINEKYKGVSVRDPKAADKTQETMDLYKKHGVNPMGGCLPMALQFPILIAFYKVFSVSVEMRGATWLWVTDLSQPEHLPIHILPVVMVASQFLMQKMMPQPGATDPSQQWMTKFMPLIFGFMFYKLSSGLVLYYLTSNLVNMGQQWFFNHTDTARVAALSVQPPPSKNKKKK